MFLCPDRLGAGHFCPHFPCFSDRRGKNCFSTAAKIRCRRTRTRTGTQWYTHTDICVLFIYLWIPLGGCWARFSFLGGNISELFRSGLEILFSSAIPSPMLRWNILLPFFLKKKIKSESGWVRGNPPTQHQKWTDESSGCELREGWTGGSKAIFKRKFTVCVPTMK